MSGCSSCSGASMAQAGMASYFRQLQESILKQEQQPAPAGFEPANLVNPAQGLLDIKV